MCVDVRIFAIGGATVSGRDAVLKSEFIYETAPFPACHASTIVETKSGLVAAWFGGTGERHPDVCIYVSRNVDGHWTPPVEVANGVGFEKQPPANMESGFCSSRRMARCCCSTKSAPARRLGGECLTTSTDDGKTWSPPQRLPNGILGPIKNKTRTTCQWRHPFAGAAPRAKNGWFVHFERTSDLGKNLASHAAG